jgi:purine-binding chemotaxis protein CheW
MSNVQKEASSSSLLLSTFHVHTTWCGIDTTRIQEVIKAGDLTPVHQAPEYVLGVINLRGRIVTIIDLGKKLKLENLPLTSLSRIIIVEWKGEYIGLLVNTISDVLSVSTDTLAPPPSNLENIRGKYFNGVYHMQEHLLAVLNLETLLAVEEN